MTDILSYKTELFGLVEKYDQKRKLSQEVGPDYYDPGMMENLDQYLGVYDEQNHQIRIRCEAKGLRYDNRTVNLERVSVGDPVQILRDQNNAFNSKNFDIHDTHHASLGYLPAELCNALGPLYDAGCADILDARISYIEKIGERSRYAKQGVLFVEIIIRLKGV